MLKDYFLLTLLNYRQNYKLGTGIPIRAQRVKRSNNADITWALKLKFIDCKLDFISLILDILKNF